MDEIKILIDQYYQFQKHRIALGNEVFAQEKNGKPNLFLTEVQSDMLAIEKKIDKHIARAVKSHPMYPWFKEVKGIGPVFAAGLIATIDIAQADHVSSIWKYAGLAPGQGRKKGVKLDYNPFLKTLCWKISNGFIKTKGKYRDIYDTSKLYYQAKFPNEVKEGNRVKYTKGHIHAMSLRRTVKLFLSDYWVAARTQAGLSVTPPFAHRHDENFKYKE